MYTSVVKSIAAAQLRKELSAALRGVAKRRTPIMIERRGRPVAALVPADAVSASGNAVGPRLAIDLRVLADFCERHHVKTLYLFGSALTGAFDSKSDVDIMFEPEGEAPSYFEQMKMTDELQELFGRPVDLVTRRAVEASSNPFRKRAILQSARVIYGR